MGRRWGGGRKVCEVTSMQLGDQQSEREQGEEQRVLREEQSAEGAAERAART